MPILRNIFVERDNFAIRSTRGGAGDARNTDGGGRSSQWKTLEGALVFEEELHTMSMLRLPNELLIFF